MKKRRFLCGLLAAVSACILTGFSMTAAAAGNIWSSTTARDANNDIQVNFEEIQVTLPQSWSGKCRMSTSGDTVSFYQIKSRDLWTEKLGYSNGGWLFSISCDQDYSFEELPSYQTIGTGTEGIYYMSFPTDMQAYTEDAEAYGEFMQMTADVDWIRDTVILTAADSSGSDYASAGTNGDYIFSQSSSACLSESDLTGMTADQIQMAINEIYARHGRRFVLPEIQEYFDSKSWYQGTVDADAFDVSVMNQYEGANIGLMVGFLNKASTGQSEAASQSSTADCYGMIIENGSGYIKVRQEDGSTIQFWYDSGKLADMNVTEAELTAGAITSLIYDTESYEAVSILVW